MPLVALIFGWPAVIASMLLTLAGIAGASWRAVLALSELFSVPRQIGLFYSPYLYLV